MRWLLVIILVAATTVGDVFRSMGMRQRPPNVPYIVISTSAMAISFFTFMKLIAITPMSFAVPMSAASFIPETFLAKALLKESVGWERWAGVGLILAGVVFIAQ